MNLDELSQTELEELVAKAEKDKQALGVELYPEKPAGYMRATNCLVKYAKEKIEYMHNKQFGRDSRVKNNQETLNKIYRTIPEEFRW